MARVRESGMPPIEQWEVFFSPQRILDALFVNGMSGDAAEFGCGYGTFTIAAAQRISGTLFATDIDDAMIDTTRERAAQAGLRNIVLERRDFVAHGCGLQDESMDFVLLFNILHIEDPVTLLREACRVLRPGGSVAVIHWRPDIDTPRGPPLAIRPRPAECRAWAQSAGLQWTSAPPLPGTPWHWGMTLGRASRSDPS